jgi:hypothetical protein
MGYDITYYVNNKPHHTTIIEKIPMGLMYHRVGDEPAIIQKNPDGSVYYMYYRNGLLHRDGDKPAVIKFNKSGINIYESYYKNGLKHREKGPSVLGLNNRKYFIKNIEYKEADFYAEITKLKFSLLN